jgi:Ca2+-binding RTX toxin-like protein
MYNAGAGNDSILGSAFADRLNGGAGDDIIFGGGGNDVIADGSGSDTLLGGSLDLGSIEDNTREQNEALFSGGNDTYILGNDGADDIIFGFDGIDGWSAGPQDFLWLQGYGAGSTLHLADSNPAPGTLPHGDFVTAHLYEVLDSLGVVEDAFVLVLVGRTADDVARPLGAGDYGWLA